MEGLLSTGPTPSSLQNDSLANGIIFHCLLLNWHLQINSVVLPLCSPLVLETFLKCDNLKSKSNFNRNEVRLVITEHIETNQIVFISVRGIYNALRNHLACVTCHFTASPKPEELET